MISCEKCKNTLPDDTKFCAYCGNEIIHTEQKCQTEVYTHDNSNITVPINATKKKKPVAIIILSILCVLLFGSTCLCIAAI